MRAVFARSVPKVEAAALRRTRRDHGHAAGIIDDLETLGLHDPRDVGRSHREQAEHKSRRGQHREQPGGAGLASQSRHLGPQKVEVVADVSADVAVALRAAGDDARFLRIFSRSVHA
jgi:hypothetical protein